MGATASLQTFMESYGTDRFQLQTSPSDCYWASRIVHREYLPLSISFANFDLSLRGDFSHQIQLMSVMDKVIEEDVGQCRVAQGIMPGGHRRLAGNDGRAGLVTTFRLMSKALLSNVKLCKHYSTL